MSAPSLRRKPAGQRVLSAPVRALAARYLCGEAIVTEAVCDGYRVGTLARDAEFLLDGAELDDLNRLCELLAALVRVERRPPALRLVCGAKK